MSEIVIYELVEDGIIDLGSHVRMRVMDNGRKLWTFDEIFSHSDVIFLPDNMRLFYVQTPDAERAKEVRGAIRSGKMGTRSLEQVKAALKEKGLLDEEAG